MRVILRRVLTACGYDDFVDAESAGEALEALRAGPLPDIGLVDWNMPGMSGLEFVQAVRAQSEFDAIPLMMVTSETSVEHIQAAMEAGADEYVMKPFTPEILRDKLDLLRSRAGEL
jgi:two-component system chemotaxis response regulator CheY